MIRGVMRVLGFKTKAKQSKPFNPKIVLVKGVFGFFTLAWLSKHLNIDLEFITETNNFQRQSIKNVPNLSLGFFKPTIYLPFSFMQVMATWLEDRIFLQQSDEIIQGLGVLHHIPLSSKAENSKEALPLVIIVAGSLGLDRGVNDLAEKSYFHGFRTVLVEVDDFHDTNKLSKMVTLLKERYKASRIFGVGQQYGANLLVNAAADHPDLFTGVVSIGNPLDLKIAETRVQKSIVAKIFYLSSMKDGRLKEQSKKLPQKPSLYRVDQHLYKLNSDQQLQNFKKNNSSINKISELQTKCLFIQSKTDPFSTQLDQDPRVFNPNCLIVLTKAGGHNEWFECNQRNRWANTTALEYIENVIKICNEKPELMRKQKPKAQDAKK